MRILADENFPGLSGQRNGGRCFVISYFTTEDRGQPPTQSYAVPRRSEVDPQITQITRIEKWITSLQITQLARIN